MKIRIKFTKTGVLKFVGHLDLLRMFQKAFRRASIPIAYSQGFNPHQQISIGAPLPIGVTSEGEYMDIQLSGPITPADAMDALNQTLPEEIRITNWIELDDQAKSSMAILQGGAYKIKCYKWNLTFEETLEKLEAFMEKDEIIITKISKKKEKEMDIREGILKLEYLPDEDTFYMLLATGSQFNVKPEFVLEAFSKFVGSEYDPYNFNFHRVELYTYSNDELIPLDQI
jgi:radical SAM-linked protein